MFGSTTKLIHKYPLQSTIITQALKMSDHAIGDLQTMAKAKTGEQNGQGTVAEVKASANIMVGVPTALKELIDNAATAAEMTVSGWVRKYLADAFDFVLPATAARGRVSKYAHILDPQARKDARAKDISDQQAQVRAVLKAIKAGKLNTVDINALVEEFGAPTRTRKTKETVAA